MIKASDISPFDEVEHLRFLDHSSETISVGARYRRIISNALSISYGIPTGVGLSFTPRSSFVSVLCTPVGYGKTRRFDLPIADPQEIINHVLSFYKISR